MGVEERDKYTGHMTTGHEWNGIKELNTRVPRVIWITLSLAFVFAVICWILYPAWPLGVTYTKGLLETNQHIRVDKDVERAIDSRAVWTDKIISLDYGQIQDDPNLMKIVRETGQTLFLDNCAACHGRTANGGPGFPSLRDKAWLWGGTPEAISETIRVGINASNDDTRMSQMLAFGHDQMLTRNQIDDVINYVLSLNKSAAQHDVGEASIASGKTVFLENCASCHGENAEGSIEVGAPNLTDDHWIYGGTRQAIFTTVWKGRMGQMPSWQGRLSAVDQKILTLYLLDLGTTDAEKSKSGDSGN